MSYVSVDDVYSSSSSSISSSDMKVADEIIEKSNEQYMKAVDEIIEKYEEAARWEQNYLLNSAFPLNDYIQIQCGLSPARSFSAAIIMRNYVTGSKISFSTYEWHTLLDLLQRLKTDFFQAPIQGWPDEYDPVTHCCGDYATVTQLVYEDTKRLHITKYNIYIELFLFEVDELLKLDTCVLSHRISMLNSLEFCVYYYHVLAIISDWINSHKISLNFEEIINSFCDVSNDSILSNALREYLYFYKTNVLSDISNKMKC